VVKGYLKKPPAASFLRSKTAGVENGLFFLRRFVIIYGVRYPGDWCPVLWRNPLGMADAGHLDDVGGMEARI
jgi:hypothetical protein